MKAGFARVDSEIRELRGEIKEVDSGLRGEIKALGTDLRVEIRKGNAELRAEIASLSTQFAALNQTLIRVAFGFAAALVAGVLVNLL